MNVSVENLAPCKKLVRVELDAAAVDATFDAVTKDIQKQASLLGLTGAMTVTVLTETSLGVVTETPVGAGLLGSGWNPSLTGMIVTNLLPLLGPDKTAVAFRFRAVTGNWTIDDVYVDPICRR